jgi:hypothetical protein
MNHTLLKLMPALLCALLATRVHAEAATTSNAPPRASATQVATLVSLQHHQYTFPRDADTNASQQACVSANLSTIATGNGPAHATAARLAKVRQQIDADCAARIAKLKQSIPLFEGVARQSLERAYATRLTASQAQTLIDYYSAEKGKRYLRFQEAIAPFAAYGMVMHTERIDPSRRPSDDVLKVRMKALRQATIYRTLEVQHEDAFNAGRDTSGFAVVGIMIMSSAIGANAALDKIDADYAADLPAFDAFASSEPEKAEQRVMLESARMSAGIAAAQARTLDPKLNGNALRWQQVYDSMTD